MRIISQLEMTFGKSDVNTSTIFWAPTIAK